MRRMRKILSALTMLVVLLMSACSPNSKTPSDKNSKDVDSEKSAFEQNDETMTFAVCGPMTGDNAQFGVEYTYAAQVMADIWNERGGLLGKKIKIISYDDKASPEEATTAGQQAVENKDVVGVIGHWSSACSMAAAPIYEEGEMLMISPSSSHPDLTGMGEWIWRVSPLTSEEADTTVAIAVNHFKSERLGFLVQQDDWGIGVSNAEKAAIPKFAKMGGIDTQIVAEEKCISGNDDYSAIITNFKAADVDTIMIDAFYPIAIPFITQLRQVMPNVNLIAHGNVFNDQVIKVCGDYAEGLVCNCSFAYFFTDDASVEFTSRYMEKSDGKFPSKEAALAYDTAGVLFEAVNRAGNTKNEDIRAQLSNISYKGITGLIKFDENRNSPRTQSAVMVKDGEWKEAPSF